MDYLRYANRIKMERLNKKLSQKKLAEMVGLDNSVLSRVESGERDITVGNLLKIADALNINPEYLLLDFVPEDYYSDSEYLWKQISKLDPLQQKTIISIIMILTQNNEQWRDTGQEGFISTETNKSVDYTEIGKRIRAQRLKNQLSQERLSELAGISTSFLGSVERGEEILSIETLFKLANALRVPVSWLLMNANSADRAAGLHDAVEGLSQSDGNKNSLLLNILMLLADNADKW